MIVEVEMNNYSIGKRKLKIMPKNFEISTELWNNLCDFAETDIYCSRGSYDWNYNTLYLCKSTNLQELLEKYCISVEELELFRDFKKEHWGSNLKIRRLFVINTFNRRVTDLTEDYAYFSRKDEKGTFRAKLSDKVKEQGVKLYSLVEISVLANREWVVTDIVE